jgi:hypothetical protein
MSARTCLALLFLAGLAGGLTAQPVPEGIRSPSGGRPSLCGMTAASISALEAELSRLLPALPGNDRFGRYEDRPNRRIWTFTTAAHPAHPAVACGTVATRDGMVGLDMQIFCLSTRETCDALHREFEELNAQVRRRLNKH